MSDCKCQQLVRDTEGRYPLHPDCPIHIVVAREDLIYRELVGYERGVEETGRLRQDLARVTGELYSTSVELHEAIAGEEAAEAKLAAAEALIQKLDAQLSPMVDAREDWIAKEARLLDKLAEATRERDEAKALARRNFEYGANSDAVSVKLEAKLAEAEARANTAAAGRDELARVLLSIDRDDTDCVHTFDENTRRKVRAALGRGTP